MNFLKINVNDDDQEINDFLIIFDKFGKRPNKVIIHDTFSGSLFKDVIKFDINADEFRLTELIPNENGYLTNEKISIEIDKDIWCSFIIINKESESHIISEVCFYYKETSQYDIVDEIIKKLSECVIDYGEDSIDKFNTISISESGLEIEPISLNFENMEEKFNTNTLKKIDKIQKKIKKMNKGITIFTGDKGLGKTEMAKYLSSKIDRMIIFIPNNMIDLTINNPEFKNFIKKFEKTLIVVDDCEFLTTNQFTKHNNFTNNIVQMVDGFLSDILNLQFLLVFNQRMGDIDDELIDCNHLIDVVEFDLLNKDTATDLSKIIGHNRKYKESTSLIDVYKNKKSDKSIRIGI